jgi:hypothetical protein
MKQATSLGYLRGDKAIDPDKPRTLKAAEWLEDKMGTETEFSEEGKKAIMEIVNKQIDIRKLWAFLEKWTQPHEDAFPQWKKELDEIFL